MVRFRYKCFYCKTPFQIILIKTTSRKIFNIFKQLTYYKFYIFDNRSRLNLKIFNFFEGLNKVYQ